MESETGEDTDDECHTNNAYYLFCDQPQAMQNISYPH